jgi:glycosyltransferase involved in cell wall biosynthesis
VIIAVLAAQSSMLINSPAAHEAWPQPITAARVAILICTKNGAEFLDAQLKSIARQTHTNWSLFASDDDSTDKTRDILERFGQHRPQNVEVRDGPNKGVCVNFLSLAIDPSIRADYYAFSDQDDIWYPDKLGRALNWLVSVPEGVPGLYCGRTELMSVDGQHEGFSPLFTRQPAFENALVQNLAGGNTMIFNHATKVLLEYVGKPDVILHDWWLYQLVSAAGGMIHYDHQPMIKYRQHRHNLIGSNQGWGARFIRIRTMLGGRVHDSNAKNIAALNRIPKNLITSQNREVLMLFANATNASLLKRLIYLKRSRVYRQTFLGNFGLLAAALIKRI